MRLLIRFLIGIAALAVIITIAAFFILPTLNSRQASGEIELPGLKASVQIKRDAFGMPYIFAQNMEDALRGQGFVTGQDRLFQLEAAKRAATGRLAEAFGAGTSDVILKLDQEARVIGFHRLAVQQEALLSPIARKNLEAYLEGLNAYIMHHTDTHPLEFKMAGFEPEPWSLTDALAFVYYSGWGSAANFDAELIAHKIIQTVGVETFEQIAPVTVNPDSPAPLTESRINHDPSLRWAGPTATPAEWTNGGWRQQGVGGSNNWAMSGAKSGSPAAIVTNDPHLDSRTLPGPWYPVGLITPELRAVGVSAGLPGIVVGRNEHIAFGVTNAYADAVDLYIETIDPNNAEHYLEGDQSFPFDKVTEIIRIKDDTAEGGFREQQLVVRLTRRGPVITDHRSDSESGSVLSMRWAAAEFMGPDLGLEALITAQNVDDAIAAIEAAHTISLNFIVGDVTGRIGRRASGATPIRLRGDGMSPFPVTDGVDNWGGRIPAEQMPGEIDPARGWTGTANHMTAPADYPYVYTTFASPSYRYRRMQELFDQPRVTAEDAWDAQYDTLNIFARDLAPILSRALLDADDEALTEVGQLLKDWDYHDEQDALAPTLFQEIIRQLAQLTFEDELGPDATAAYLSSWYVWQQRFDAMVQEGTSPWFDDTRTPEKETLAMLTRRAGKLALERLTNVYGKDRSNWYWGKVHQVHFHGPLRQEGWIGRLTGGRSVPMSGSGETLLRALYPYDDPFDSKWFASLRMTADLNDSEKVRAILPGGAVGRTFHPNLADQTTRWADREDVSYWWFSDDAIEDNTETVLTLRPQ
jgi:penicillin amidase